MRVLLCDDEQLLADALASVLGARGHDVRLTAAPSEAVAVAAQWRPELCVMDRSFPEGDVGVDAARRVLEAAPGVTVLMLTGDPDPPTARSALTAGVRGFLRKDEPLDVILDALDQVAAGLLVVDPGVLRPAAAARPPLATLTAREQEVLERIVQGQSGHVMAEAMQVSYSTTRTHMQNVLTKLGVHSQLEAAAYAVQHGLVQSRAG